MKMIFQKVGTNGFEEDGLFGNDGPQNGNDDYENEITIIMKMNKTKIIIIILILTQNFKIHLQYYLHIK